MGFWAGSISSIEVLKVSLARSRVSNRRGKPLQTVSRHPNLNWKLGKYPLAQQVRPVRSGTGDGLPRTAESRGARSGGGGEPPTRQRGRC
ncbi:hypothetical protein D0A34_05665 [Microcoleus vaginatus PCC 9802]|nr:hypothetical protein D0A34_05665 [Microcoleus vaginatus PCC 9802]